MIIAIIPNKNDGWILDLNLKILTRLCDFVIVGLDNCTDKSEEICLKYKNTIIINNPSSDIVVGNKNRRQELLERARKISNESIIIAVDADEVFSEQILNSNIIKRIQVLKKGDALGVNFRELWFSPLLYRSENKSSWSGRIMPCIWRDNGIDYESNNWHEERIPVFNIIENIQVDLIHFARVLPVRYWSRMRYYIARDIYYNNKNAVKTNYMYAITKDEKGIILSPLKKEWFPSFDLNELNKLQFQDHYFNWFNDRVLELILNDEKNVLKNANIWDFDWVYYYKLKNTNSISNQSYEKLIDRRSTLEKKVNDYIKANYNFPFYSIYFYEKIIKSILIKFRLFNFIKSIFTNK